MSSITLIFFVTGLCLLAKIRVDQTTQLNRKMIEKLVYASDLANQGLLYNFLESSSVDRLIKKALVRRIRTCGFDFTFAGNIGRLLHCESMQLNDQYKQFTTTLLRSTIMLFVCSYTLTPWQTTPVPVSSDVYSFLIFTAYCLVLAFNQPAPLLGPGWYETIIFAHKTLLRLVRTFFRKPEPSADIAFKMTFKFRKIFLSLSRKNLTSELRYLDFLKPDFKKDELDILIQQRRVEFEKFKNAIFAADLILLFPVMILYAF